MADPRISKSYRLMYLDEVKEGMVLLFARTKPKEKVFCVCADTNHIHEGSEECQFIVADAKCGCTTDELSPEIEAGYPPMPPFLRHMTGMHDGPEEVEEQEHTVLRTRDMGGLVSLILLDPDGDQTGYIDKCIDVVRVKV